MILAPIVVGLIAAVATMGVAGMFLPKAHLATRSLKLGRPPEEVWAVISDFQAATSWRSGIKSVERSPDQDGHPVWRETDRRGHAVPFEVVELSPPRRMVMRIADPKLPFGGRWTYALEPESGGCRLRITEDGEIYNPMFRYIAKLMGYTGTMDAYLKALGAKLGGAGPVEP